MQRKIIYKLQVCFIVFGLLFLTACGKKQLSLKVADASKEENLLLDHVDDAAVALSTETAIDSEVAEFAELTEDSKTTYSTTENCEDSLYPVYVCGAVLHSGVYYLDAGDIKDVAIQAAGGFTDDAEKTYVNLAEEISYGEQIYVPTRDELEQMNNNGGYMPWIQEASGQKPSDSQTEGYSDTKRVNLNTATKSELMGLPGIGESKANAIIQYREARGYFQDVTEVMQVEGIKDGVYDKIKDFIVVE